MTTRLYYSLIPATLIVLGDEWIKFEALKRLPDEGSLVHPGWIDLAIHKNYGIAFDIPFRLEIIVVMTIIIGLILLNIAYKHRFERPTISCSAIVIVLGALGNLYDRVAYGFTVDYLLLFGRSAINLSDLMILFGVFLLLMSSRKKRTVNHQHAG